MKMTWQLFPSIGLVLYKVMSSLPPSSVSVERWESGGSISPDHGSPAHVPGPGCRISVVVRYSSATALLKHGTQTVKLEACSMIV